MNLQYLISRIEAADGPDRELRAEIGRAFGIKPKLKNVYKRRHYPLIFVRVDEIYPAFESSIDAAMTLVLDGFILQLSEWDHEDLRAKGPWQAILTQAGKRDSDLWGYRCDHAATPALALCAAALRAVMAKNEG